MLADRWNLSQRERSMITSRGANAGLWPRHKAVQWAICMVACQFAVAAHGAVTWSGSGGDGNWATPENWTGSAIPASTDDVIFGSSGSLTVKVAASGVTASTLTLNNNAGAYVFTGGPLTFGSVATGAPTVITSATTSLVKFNLDVLINYNSPGINAGNLEFNGSLGGVRTPDFYINQNRTVVVNGVMSGAGNLYINGSSNSFLELNNANTYTGSTTIQNTTTRIRNAQAFGNVTSEISIGAGTANSAPSLMIANNTTLARKIRIVSPSAGFTNIVKLGGDSAADSGYSGNIALGSDNATAAGVTLTAAAGGKVTFSGNLLRAAGATGTGDSVLVDAVGTVVMSGSGNTYSGATTVSSGSLLVDGTLMAGGAAVSVKSGATLGGVGTINRQVVVENGGKLLKQGTDGLKVSALQLSDTSVIDWQPDAQSPGIIVAGNLVLDGLLNVNESQTLTAGTYNLFTAASITDNGLTIANMPAGAHYQIITTANSVDLVVAPVPEVATCGLLGSLSVVLLTRRAGR